MSWTGVHTIGKYVDMVIEVKETCVVLIPV